MVLWPFLSYGFFPLNIFIHVTVRCDAEHVALLPGGQYTGHCTAADNQPGPHNRPSSTSLPAVHTETRTAADPQRQYRLISHEQTAGHCFFSFAKPPVSGLVRSEGRDPRP